MFIKTPAALLLLCLGASAQAQTCPCNGTGTRLATAAALQALLSDKMVCADLGSEQWQEWHNGGSSGPVVDFKRGRDDPVDPSETVGSYVIASDATVSYTYGSSTYKYAVCETGGTYAFCGAAYGGRNILAARVGGAGLTACSNVLAAPASASRKVR